METKREIAYRKLVMFYIALVVVTGLGAVVMALSPNLPECSQTGSGTVVAYLCSPDGVTYVVQLMIYALALSLGCLALVVAMHHAGQREN